MKGIWGSLYHSFYFGVDSKLSINKSFLKKKNVSKLGVVPLYHREADFIVGPPTCTYGQSRESTGVSCTALLGKFLSQIYRYCGIRWGINKENPEYLGCSGIPEILSLLPKKIVILEKLGPTLLVIP